jgi:ABC-type antimicrobial peptide transport system permease subunit
MQWLYLKATICGLLVMMAVLVGYVLRIAAKGVSQEKATGVDLIKALTIQQPLFWVMLLCAFATAWLFYALTYSRPVALP